MPAFDELQRVELSEDVNKDGVTPARPEPAYPLAAQSFDRRYFRHRPSAAMFTIWCPLTSAFATGYPPSLAASQPPRVRS
jgi:hypothetical protein